jgi:hypothetical protein
MSSTCAPRYESADFLRDRFLACDWPADATVVVEAAVVVALAAVVATGWPVLGSVPIDLVWHDATPVTFGAARPA